MIGLTGSDTAAVGSFFCKRCRLIQRFSMGSVNGVARHWQKTGQELSVIWLDAHADYNTPATTLSGNMHGPKCVRPAIGQNIFRASKGAARYFEVADHCNSSFKSSKQDWQTHS